MAKRWDLSIAAWTLGLFVAYVLSTGPVIKLAVTGVISVDVCQTIYFPLQPVARIPVAGVLLKEYVTWWTGPLD